MKKIIIVGANEFQNKLVLKAKELGVETHVFAWENGAVAKENADFFYPISITDENQILLKAQEIKPDAICSIASDLAMPTVNVIAEKLKLIGNSIVATNYTTNKYEMRKKLEKDGLPCPFFHLVKFYDEIPKNVIFPLIVKPIDRSGSRGITKVVNEQELKIAIENAKRVSFSEVVLVEEYIDGDEYSIEMISQKGKHQFLQITEKFTTGEPFFIEKGHLSPPRKISEKQEAKIIFLVKKILDCLEIENGASHSEIKINSQGEIKIIEIGGRMGGDFIGSDMVQISKNIDFTKLVLDVALGKKIDDYEKRKYISNAVVSFIFDEKDLKNFETIQKKYANVIMESFINDKKEKNITDSSKRNGYFIMNIKNKVDLKNILRILGEKI